MVQQGRLMLDVDKNLQQTGRAMNIDDAMDSLMNDYGFTLPSGRSGERSVKP
jgi:hypothetical protein